MTPTLSAFVKSFRERKKKDSAVFSDEGMKPKC